MLTCETMLSLPLPPTPPLPHPTPSLRDDHEEEAETLVGLSRWSWRARRETSRVPLGGGAEGNQRDKVPRANGNGAGCAFFKLGRAGPRYVGWSARHGPTASTLHLPLRFVPLFSRFKQCLPISLLSLLRPPCANPSVSL